MRAAVRVAPGRVAIVDRPAPERAERETLIRVERVALCGGDLLYFRGPMPFQSAIPEYADEAYVVCHEAVGVVVETSEDSHVKPGDCVTIDPQVRCGECPYCRSSAIELCPARRDMGYSTDGAAAEHIAIPTERVLRVPDGMSLDAAAATHGLAAVLHALSAVDLANVERALVLGPGPAGLMFTMALLAKIPTRRVSLVGRPSPRLDIAAALGAETIELRDPTLAELRYVWSDDRGYDLVVETTGAPEICEASVWCARPKGSVLLYAPTSFTLDGNVVFRRELRILGSTGATGGMEPALELIASGAVPLERIITHSFEFDRIQEAFELAIAAPERRDGLLKAVVRIS